MTLCDINPNDIDDEDLNEFGLIPDNNYNWLQSRNDYSNEEILNMDGFLEREKLKHITIENRNSPPLDTYNQLNSQQQFAYFIVDEYNKSKKQLFLTILGQGGVGKSHTVYAISHLLNGHVKRCAPTAKAAFLIKGETIHSLLHIPIINSKNMIELNPTLLAELQLKFKGLILIIKNNTLSNNNFKIILIIFRNYSYNYRRILNAFSTNVRSYR